MSEAQYTINNCTAASFAFLCPRHWSGLKKTEDAGVRFCSKSNKQVHLCVTGEELQLHTDMGHCFAVDGQEKLTTARKVVNAEIDAVKKMLNRPLVGYLAPKKLSLENQLP